MIDHTRDITERDRRTQRSLLLFAIVIALVVIIWLGFTHYL